MLREMRIPEISSPIYPEQRLLFLQIFPFNLNNSKIFLFRPSKLFIYFIILVLRNIRYTHIYGNKYVVLNKRYDTDDLSKLY